MIKRFFNKVATSQQLLSILSVKEKKKEKRKNRE
jgi:hypothetical protein